MCEVNGYLKNWWDNIILTTNSMHVHVSQVFRQGELAFVMSLGYYSTVNG